MENRHIFTDSFIHICTRNPIVIWAISNSLMQSSLTWRAVQSFAVPLPVIPHKVNIALFDVSAIPEWPELIPRWAAAGYKPILIVGEYWGYGGAQLRALHLGVAGIVDVTAELGKRIVDAITFVASGQVFARENTAFKRHARLKSPNSCPPAPCLSFREEQVLDLLFLGFSNKRIGNALGISERTAKFHVCNILRKLHLRSRGDLRSVDANILIKAEPQSVSKDTLPLPVQTRTG